MRPVFRDNRSVCALPDISRHHASSLTRCSPQRLISANTWNRSSPTVLVAQKKPHYYHYRQSVDQPSFLDSTLRSSAIGCMGGSYPNILAAVAQALILSAVHPFPLPLRLPVSNTASPKRHRQQLLCCAESEEKSARKGITRITTDKALLQR